MLNSTIELLKSLRNNFLYFKLQNLFKEKILIYSIILFKVDNDQIGCISPFIIPLDYRNYENKNIIEKRYVVRDPKKLNKDQNIHFYFNNESIYRRFIKIYEICIKILVQIVIPRV